MRRRDSRSRLQTPWRALGAITAIAALLVASLPAAALASGPAPNPTTPLEPAADDPAEPDDAAPDPSADVDPDQPADRESEPAEAPPEPDPDPDEPAEAIDGTDGDDIATSAPDATEGAADDDTRHGGAADDVFDVAPDAEAGPPPLTRLQTAGWWTLFGAFAVGTTAGVFAGLAERQEDRALRLATLFDAETGRQPLYADHADDYERYLQRGRAYQRTAIGLAAVTGTAAIAAVVMFALDASRRRASASAQRRWRPRATVRARGAGWEVRF
jgi:hypothetical protein